MSVSLKARSVKGIVWTLMEKFGVQGIKFVLGIVLARLLTPEDFGIIGIIMVFFVVAQVIVDSGFAQAYVQKKHINDDDANTVFYTNLIISIVLYFILFFTAPAIARFYEEKLLVQIVRVMGLVVIIHAFSIIQTAQITRSVNFKRKTTIILTATIVSGTVGIISALYGYGVWALVIQNMLQASITSVGLWITSKWKPGFSFSIVSFKEMFSYGFWIFLAGVMRKIFDNIYILTIGKFFPALVAGYYVQAKKIQQHTSEQIVSAIGIVSFPVFSKLQDDKKKLKKALQMFLRHSLVIMMPLQIVLLVVAKPFVILFLTEKWSSMIPYLQLLCIVGALYPIHLLNIQVLKAQGQSNLNFKLNLMKNLLRIANIFVMIRFGVLYIIIGEVFVSTVALIVNTYFTWKFVDYGFFKQIKDIKEIVIGITLSGVIGYLILMKIENLWIKLFSGIFIVSLIFILTQFIFNRTLFREFVDLKKIIKRNKGNEI